MQAVTYSDARENLKAVLDKGRRRPRAGDDHTPARRDRGADLGQRVGGDRGNAAPDVVAGQRKASAGRDRGTRCRPVRGARADPAVTIVFRGDAWRDYVA